MYIKATDNWIAILGKHENWYNTLTDLNGLTPRQVRETCDKVFGKDKMYVIPHGTVIVVHDVDKYNEMYPHRPYSRVEYKW